MFAAKNELLTRPNGGYKLTRSLRFRSSASAYLNRTLTTPTNNLKWTWSGWVKRGLFGSQLSMFIGGTTTTNNYMEFQFNTSDKLFVEQYASGYTVSLTSNAVFRDPAAWYHLIVVYDSANATAANRCIAYINGVQVTWSSPTYPSLNLASFVNSAINHEIGRQGTGAPQAYFDGYMAEVNFIDGQALTPSSFGAFSIYNQWLPIKYAGTYGTNGFYLPFTNNASAATLGNDFSGNSNTWTTNNISVTAGSTYDSMTDVPTLTSATAANYDVLNPVALPAGGSITNGNLQWTHSSTGNYGGCLSTIALPTSQAIYMETVVTSLTGSANWVGFGLSFMQSITTGGNTFASANTCYYGTRLSTTQAIYNQTTTVRNDAGITFTTGDILQMAYDPSSGKVWFGKNNAWFDSGSGTTGNPSAGTNATFTYAPTVTPQFFWTNTFVQSSGTSAIAFNFGQRPFSYTPPTGYLALNTFNL